MDPLVGIDTIDKRILTHLSKDARKSFRKIGREIGVSSVTVGSRVRRLMDEGYITGFITAINPKKFGKDISVIFGLNISPNMVDTVTNRLKVLPQVTLMYSVSGNYNLMVHGLFKGAGGAEHVPEKGVVHHRGYQQRTHLHHPKGVQTLPRIRSGL